MDKNMYALMIAAYDAYWAGCCKSGKLHTAAETGMLDEVAEDMAAVCWEATDERAADSMLNVGYEFDFDGQALEMARFVRQYVLARQLWNCIAWEESGTTDTRCYVGSIGQAHFNITHGDNGWGASSFAIGSHVLTRVEPQATDLPDLKRQVVQQYLDWLAEQQRLTHQTGQHSGK